MRSIRFLLILNIFLLLVFAGQNCLATSTAGVLYLKVAPGARPAGMGEAFISIADDATATYWNPAGLGNAPLAGSKYTKRLARFGDITDAASVLEKLGGVTTYVLADGQLLIYNGASLDFGNDYLTSGDQTLIDFLRAKTSQDDEEKLKKMGALVIAANISVTPEEVNRFIDSVKFYTPDDYEEADELSRLLVKLKTGYDGCLLSEKSFRNMEKALAEGLEDGSLTPDELNRITYAQGGGLNRFLPRNLTIPLSAGIGANLTCLGKSGEHFIWIGTDNGVFRRAGDSPWAHFTTLNGLPSDTILCLENQGDAIFIGTTKGIAKFKGRNFEVYDYIPAEPVQAIGFFGLGKAYAVIGDLMYSYDGHGWSESYNYRVRTGETMDDLIAKSSIYHTASEYEYLRQKILELNKDQIRQKQTETSPVEAPAANTSPEDSTVASMVENSFGTEDISDETADSLSEEAVVEELTEDVDWITAGMIISLPHGPKFKYEVTAIHSKEGSGAIWVGTSHGLLEYRGESWHIHGYVRHVVPSGDSLGQGVPMTALEIAASSLPLGTEEQLAILAQGIDETNDLFGNPVAPGEEVYVYRSNIGSRIYSIGSVYDELYVGTEHGLYRFSEGKWVKSYAHNTGKSVVIATYELNKNGIYVSRAGITTETQGRKEVILMHVDWLPDFDLDMYYEFGSYVHNVRGLGTFGINIIYLNYGEIEFTDSNQESIKYEEPFELTVGLSFGTSITRSIKGGMGIKFIHSHLSTIGAGQEQGDGIASTVALDLGLLFVLNRRLQVGTTITNLGPNITYVNAAQSDPLPRNLGLGVSYKLLDIPYNKLVIQGELNKIMVNLNHGFATELEWATRHIGFEYSYSDLFAGRAGYKYDKEGQVRHFTFGAGLMVSIFRFDFAYIPSTGDSPLSNTLRMSLTFRI